MIGNLFLLACTALLGVSMATPLVQTEFQLNPQLVVPYGWYDGDFSSESSTVTINVNQFKGQANLVRSNFQLTEDGDGDIIFYTFDTGGNGFITYGSMPNDLTIQSELLSDSPYLGGLLTYYDVDGNYLEITPYWNRINTSFGVNYTFCFLFDCYDYDNNTSKYSIAHFYSCGQELNRIYDGDWYTFDYNVGLTDFGAYYRYPFVFGGDITIRIEFLTGYDYSDLKLNFCTGARSSASSQEYQQGYIAGYENGRNDGYQSGLSDGYNQGFTEGNAQGYQNGYSEGIAFASGSTSFNALFGAIADTPVVFLRSLFNFDLFGMNMFIIIMSLLTGIVVMFVIKKVWK